MYYLLILHEFNMRNYLLTYVNICEINLQHQEYYFFLELHFALRLVSYIIIIQFPYLTNNDIHCIIHIQKTDNSYY